MRLIHLAALVFLAGSALAKPIAPNAMHKRQSADSLVPGMTQTSIDAPTTTTEDLSATCTALYTSADDEYCGDLADRFDVWLWDEEYELAPDSTDCEDVLRQYRICKTEPLVNVPATSAADATADITADATVEATTSKVCTHNVATTITLNGTANAAATITLNGTANATATVSNSAVAATCTCNSTAPLSNASSPWNAVASSNGTVLLSNGTLATNASGAMANCTRSANASSITLTLLATRTLSYMRTLSYAHGTANATSLKTILVTHTDADIVEVPAPTPSANKFGSAANSTGLAANVTSTALSASSTGPPIRHIEYRDWDGEGPYAIIGSNDGSSDLVARPDGPGAPNDYQGLSGSLAVPGSAVSLPAGAIESSAAFLATPKPTVPTIPSAMPSPSQSPPSQKQLPTTTDEAIFEAGSVESSGESSRSEESAVPQTSLFTSSVLTLQTPLSTPTVYATFETSDAAFLFATDVLWAATKSVVTAPALASPSLGPVEVLTLGLAATEAASATPTSALNPTSLTTSSVSQATAAAVVEHASTAPCNMAEGPWPCVLPSLAGLGTVTATSQTSLVISTSMTSSATSTPTASSLAYKAYYGSGAVSEGWPEQSSWVDFETMFEANRPQMKTSCAQWGVEDNTDEEMSQLKAAILSISAESSIDARFILSVIIQESTGCVRVITTQWSHLNPGLMQSHNGIGSCNPNRAANGIPGVVNTGDIQSPCPESMIVQMVRDGTMGTPSGDGLQQLFQKQQQQVLKRQSGNGTASVVGVEKYYRVARMYNGGSIAASGLLEDGCCTRSYASDIANRLVGWTTSAREFA